MWIKSISHMIILVMITCFSAAIAEEGRESNSPATVDSVDLPRYTGLWYEIARLPNRFQRKCFRLMEKSMKQRE
jgi:apolipoprotein D and lipocalin family protein